jgi:hypothetical protein
MAADWRRAFFLQARSDFDVAQRLMAMDGIAACHPLHYLQMAAEKLAKGFACRHEPLAHTHRAFTRFVQSAHLVPGMREACGTSSLQFRAYLRSIAGVASELEALAPALAGDGPNAEYPWEAAGVVTAPVEHSFARINPYSAGPVVVKLLPFIEAAVRVAEQQVAG